MGMFRYGSTGRGADGTRRRCSRRRPGGAWAQGVWGEPPAVPPQSRAAATPTAGDGGGALPLVSMMPPQIGWGFMGVFN